MKDMAEVNTKNHTGRITQIIGAVLDIKFEAGNLPEIYEAIQIPISDGSKLVVEVAQHLGCLLYTSEYGKSNSQRNCGKRIVSG